MGVAVIMRLLLMILSRGESLWCSVADGFCIRQGGLQISPLAGG